MDYFQLLPEPEDGDTGFLRKEKVYSKWKGMV